MSLALSNQSGQTPLNKKKRRDHQRQSKQVSSREREGRPVENRPETDCDCSETQEPVTHESRNWINATNAAILISILAFGVTGWQGYIARETLHYSERAYLYPDFSAGKTLATTGKKLIVIVPIINSGDTPAYNVRMSIRGNLYYSPFPKGGEFPPPSYIRSPTIAYPTVVIQQPTTVLDSLSLSDLEKLESRDAKIFFWGRMDYTTAFRDAAFTQFCYFASIDPNLPPERPWEYTPCDEGNDGN